MRGIYSLVSLFYISSVLAVFFTLFVMIYYNFMYSLLFLIFSFFSISCVFFSLGAFFSGVIEIIIYAGAIMVLFMFAIMVLNKEKYILFNRKGYNFSNISEYSGVILLAIIFFIILIYAIFETNNNLIRVYELDMKMEQISCKLFGPYMLVVEIVSFILLSALISVLHISKNIRALYFLAQSSNNLHDRKI